MNDVLSETYIKSNFLLPKSNVPHSFFRRVTKYPTELHGLARSEEGLPLEDPDTLAGVRSFVPIRKSR